MILQSEPGLRLLNDGERVHKKDLCYGETDKGDVNWCSPGPLTGKKWNKYDPRTPSIILRRKK